MNINSAFSGGGRGSYRYYDFKKAFAAHPKKGTKEVAAPRMQVAHSGAVSPSQKSVNDALKTLNDGLRGLHAKCTNVKMPNAQMPNLLKFPTCQMSIKTIKSIKKHNKTF